MIAEIDNLHRILAMANVINDLESKFELNALVLLESEDELLRKGRKFNVRACSPSQRLDLGMCYANAVEKMNKGFGYAEGYIQDKSTGVRIAHAWNITPQGQHIDFTIEDADKYEYFGVIVANETVLKVGLMNGGLSYCALPYVKKYAAVTKAQMRNQIQKLMFQNFGMRL